MAAKILVTGFEAFLGESLNPSALLLESLQDHEDIDTLLLPVAYAEAFPRLKNFCENKNHQALLMLGQAGGRAEICLERAALNWRESEKPDNTGVIAQPGHPIEPQKENALYSQAPLEKILQALKLTEVPAKISFSAGAYVCNDLYFKTLDWRPSVPALFVHVPYLPEQTKNKAPGTPALSLTDQQKALHSILESMKHHT